MADVKWIKITTDIFDDEKILLIENLPDADSLIVIWFKLLCLAGKQNNSGVFIMNNRIPYTEEMLATILRRPINTIRLAFQVFQDYGMIEITDGVIAIPNWEKHQNIDGMEKIRKQTRERVAKHREKQKLLECNVTVTESNATDKNRIDKNRTDYNKKPQAAYFEAPAVNQAFIDFVDMRKKNRSAMTDRAIKLAIGKVTEYATVNGRFDEHMAVEIINNSVLNGWKGFYPLKDAQPAKKTRFDNFTQSDMSDELAEIEALSDKI